MRNLGLFVAVLSGGFLPWSSPSLAGADDEKEEAKAPSVDRRIDEIDRKQRILERKWEIENEARVEKDVGKLNCLNAQLTQMKGLAKVATQANDALVDAVSKKDSATANTQFARVAIATDKVVRMGGEADVCLGQLAYLVDGKTSVQVEQPEGLPGQDVTQRTPPPAPLHAPPVVRPVNASNFY